MKINVLLLSIIAGGTLLLASCGGEKATETTVESGAEAVADEGKSEAEKRPSPLRTLQGTIGTANVSIQYGAPSVKGRVIWGDLVPYNEVWRTGANEATNVEFATDVTVEGQALKAGKYSLFTIPKANGKWTVIFNSEWDLEHGHFQYKQENDMLRVESTPEWATDSQEQLTIAIESPGIVVRWEKLKLPIAIQ